MEDKSFFQRMGLARDDLDAANKELAEKKYEMEVELEAIKQKYKTIIADLDCKADEKAHRLGEFTEKCRYCDNFSPAFDIVNFFSAFVSYVEAEEFIPYECYDGKRMHDKFMIVKSSVCEDDYNDIDKLYENGDLIILSPDSSFNRFSFYSSGRPIYKFGKYDYLEDFVKELILYRINNKKGHDFTVVELNKFAENYLSKHFDLVLRNEDKREELLKKFIDDSIERANKRKLVRE